MKKIIKNKVYDTTTAKKLGDWFCNTLYQKRTGEFFLHGDEKIIPVSYEKARQWAEEHLDADDYISIFGGPASDDTLTALNLTLSALAVSKFRLAAQRQQISQRELMERLIDTL